MTKERACLLSPFSTRPQSKSAPGDNCIYYLPIPASSLKLTKERACLLSPFSTSPRPRPAPIRAPTCRTEGTGFNFHASNQKILNDLWRTWLSQDSTIWLLPPTPFSKLDQRYTRKLIKRSNLLMGEGGGRRWGRSQIIGWRESLVLYKSFNTLCIEHYVKSA